MFNWNILVFVFSVLFSPIGLAQVNYKINRVAFADYKAQGGEPIFKTTFYFSDTRLGALEIECQDNSATTYMKVEAVFPGRVFKSSDFYCFALDGLVQDWRDVTDGYRMPSFQVGAAASASYTFNQWVNLPISFDKNYLYIHSRFTNSILFQFSML